jgi:hypothetical protein
MKTNSLARCSATARRRLCGAVLLPISLMAMSLPASAQSSPVTLRKFVPATTTTPLTVVDCTISVTPTSFVAARFTSAGASIRCVTPSGFPGSPGDTLQIRGVSMAMQSFRNAVVYDNTWDLSGNNGFNLFSFTIEGMTPVCTTGTTYSYTTNARTSFNVYVPVARQAIAFGPVTVTGPATAIRAASSNCRP